LGVGSQFDTVLKFNQSKESWVKRDEVNQAGVHGKIPENVVGSLDEAFAFGQALFQFHRSMFKKDRPDLLVFFLSNVPFTGMV
jgi:hypothetical protein